MTVELPSPEFRVMLRMWIHPGKSEEFERVWRSIGHRVTSSPGNLGQWLSRSESEDNLYFVVSDWATKADFLAFESSPGHIEHRQQLQPLRSKGDMESMDVLVAMAPTPGAHD